MLEVIIGLGFIAFIMAFLFSQIKYEPSEDNDNVNLIATYGVKVLFLVLSLATIVYMAWIIYETSNAETLYLTVSGNTTIYDLNTTTGQKIQTTGQTYLTIWIYILGLVVFLIVIGTAFSIFKIFKLKMDIKKGRKYV